jgi:hypothetical protein
LDVKRYEGDLNDFLSRLDHAHIQPITYIKHVSERGKDQVVIAQPFWARGSLRDLLHGEVSGGREGRGGEGRGGKERKEEVNEREGGRGEGAVGKE